MQSNGGLADAHRFRGKDSILSGPAGGIVGMARTAAAAGFGRVIGFDMGGTSTDVSHYAGEFERQYETEVAGVRMRAPMLSIHTVAAGGGSILAFDGSRYRVGPDSAGANPGPGVLPPRRPAHRDRRQRHAGPGPARLLPPGVRAGRGRAAGRRAGGRPASPPWPGGSRTATGDQRSDAGVAAGFLDIAVANMANAIKKISVQRGYDITRYVLATFGGAGGQHACAVADALGMTEVLIHPLAGVLSAYGMGLASVTAMRETAVEAELSAGLLTRLDRVAGDLEAAARAELEAGGVPGGQVRRTRRAQLRYQGTDTSLTVPFGPVDSMMAAFEAAYRQRFSFLMRDKPVMVEAVSVEVSGGGGDHPDAPAIVDPADTGVTPVSAGSVSVTSVTPVTPATPGPGRTVTPATPGPGRIETPATPGPGRTGARRPRPGCGCSPAVSGPRWTSARAAGCGPATWSPGPPSSPRTSPRPWSSRAGRPR